MLGSNLAAVRNSDITRKGIRDDQRTGRLHCIGSGDAPKLAHRMAPAPVCTSQGGLPSRGAPRIDMPPSIAPRRTGSPDAHRRTSSAAVSYTHLRAHETDS